MAQFVLFSASAYNKSVIIQSVSMNKFLKYLVEHNFTYQIDSLKPKMENFKKFSKKEDPVVDKFSSCPRIKHSIRVTLSQGCVAARVLMSDIAQQLHQKKPTFPVFIFSQLPLLKRLQLWIWTRNLKSKKMEIAFLSKSEQQSRKNCILETLLFVTTSAHFFLGYQSASIKG